MEERKPYLVANIFDRWFQKHAKNSADQPLDLSSLKKLSFSLQYSEEFGFYSYRPQINGSWHSKKFIPTYDHPLSAMIASFVSEFSEHIIHINITKKGVNFSKRNKHEAPNGVEEKFKPIFEQVKKYILSFKEEVDEKHIDDDAKANAHLTKDLFKNQHVGLMFDFDGNSYQTENEYLNFLLETEEELKATALQKTRHYSDC